MLFLKLRLKPIICSACNVPILQKSTYRTYEQQPRQNVCCQPSAHLAALAPFAGHLLCTVHSGQYHSGFWPSHRFRVTGSLGGGVFSFRPSIIVSSKSWSVSVKSCKTSGLKRPPLITRANSSQTRSSDRPCKLVTLCIFSANRRRQRSCNKGTPEVGIQASDPTSLAAHTAARIGCGRCQLSSCFFKSTVFGCLSPLRLGDARRRL